MTIEDQIQKWTHRANRAAIRADAWHDVVELAVTGDLITAQRNARDAASYAMFYRFLIIDALSPGQPISWEEACSYG